MAELSELLAARRIVVKYGTNALTIVDGSGNVLGFDREKIGGIAWIVSVLYDAGKEPILVSSAAVTAGMEINGLGIRPKDTEELQDLSSEGQAELIRAYQKALIPCGIGVMQLLVTYHNFATEADRANIRRRVERGLGKKKLPIFNINDAVTNEALVTGVENGFTDNDPLSALVAVNCKRYDGEGTSLIIVSEEGKFGSGGSPSKMSAFLNAEKEGIMTNRNNYVTHNLLETAVRNYFTLSLFKTWLSKKNSLG